MSKWDTISILERFYELHKGLYSYGDFEFTNTSQRINIICREHGDFSQQIRKHLEGQGCKRCAGTKTSSKWINPTGYREPCGKQVQYQEYTVWRAMTQRTKPNYWLSHKHYTGTTCSELFSNWDSYKGWYDNQFSSGFTDDEGKPFELDKDLLSDGSRHYSEHTCCFLPRAINIGLRNKSDKLVELLEQYKDRIEPSVYRLLINKTIKQNP